MNIWQGVHIRLRSVEPEDAETFYAWDSAETETACMVDWVWPAGSLAAARQWAEKQATRRVENDEYFFVIEALAGAAAGAPVGVINAHGCDRRVGCFKYGISIAPEFRRRGYAAEAILLLLRYFFDELRYQKATVNIYEYNPASQRLHERLGFTPEGRVRRVLFTQGRHFDELYYGLTVEEFHANYPGTTSETWIADSLARLRAE